MKRSIALIIGFCILWLVDISAQEQDLRFEHLTVEDGLSQNTVNAVIKDDRGFIWIGTNDGLNRYDGYEFTVYRRIPDDTCSLSNNKVYSILEDDRGDLWIGTANGLNRYNVRKDHFQRYLHQPGKDTSLSHNFVRYLYEDSRNNLWAGTLGGGLNLYDRQNDRFIPVQINENNELTNVTAIIESSGANLWIGSQHPGIYHYNLDTGGAEYYPFPNVPQDKKRYNKNLYKDNSGNLWIGTEGGGLYVFDPSDGRYEAFYGSTGRNSLSNEIVKDVMQVKSNIFWIATDGEGINVLNRETGKMRYIRYNVGDPESLNSEAIYSLYKDNHGIYWVGTFDGGINIFNTNAKDFHTYTSRPSRENSLSYRSVLSFHEDHKGRIWIGTDGGGLNLFDPEKETFEHFRHRNGDPRSLSSDVVTAVHQTGREILWIGTYSGGLNRFNLRTGNFTNYTHDPDNPQSIANNNVWDIQEDRYGNLWIATLSGLDKMNPEQGIFKHYNSSEKNGSNYHDRVTTLYEDDTGTLWLGGSNLKRLDREGDSLVTIDFGLFEQFDVRCIFEDQKDRLWVGTEGGGLVHYDRDNNQFHVYNTSDGLPNSAIHAILEDKQGNLWLSTNQGLCKFHPDDDIIHNYDMSDGLSTNQFSYDAAMKSDEGSFYFGSINGFTVFQPARIRKNPYEPPVVITDFQIKNEPVPIGAPGSPLDEHISAEDQITLKHNQNVFSFEFKALSYAAPGKNRYRIKMEGFDENWRDLGNRRYASYTNLPPGTYNFRVKASNNDGIWNQEGASVKVKILPPPWLTTWAFIGYGVIVLLILYGARAMVLYKARMKHEIQLKEMEKKKIEEMNNMKLQFYTNVSHEFRTPLTLILSPLEHLLSRGVNDGYIRKQLTRIHDNAKRLLHLINQLMDFRRIETGHMTLHARKTDVIRMLKDVKQAFNAFAEDHKINFSFNSGYNSYDLWIDREKMEKVFYNLLSNAFKFTPDGGKISLKIQPQVGKGAVIKDALQPLKGRNRDISGYLNIIIEDSGIGISKDRLPKIFERFHQIGGSASSLNSTLYGTNSGIGLALTKSLVELHKGEIEVESEEGKGTRFTVSIPVGKNHLDTDQLVNEKDRDLYATSKVQEYASEEELGVSEILSAEEKEDENDQHGAENKPVALLIEDDELMQQFLRNILKEEFNIYQAFDGEEGIGKAREYNPDIIVSDIMMKEKDGISLSRDLKQDLNTSHIPVILLTALQSDQYQIESFRKGADEFVTKPFNPEFLLTRMKNLIESRARLREYFRRELICEPSEVTLTSVDEQFLKRAVEIVEENISDPEFNVPGLIRELGTSRSALYRKLRALVDQSANEFIKSIRLKRAAQLLTQNELTIAEIAYRVGFNDPQYFSKSFKKMFDMTPTQYAVSNIQKTHYGKISGDNAGQ